MTQDKGIFIRNVYYMLSYAFRILRQEDYRRVAAESFDNIHALFAAILEIGVSRQLKQGLYREYIPVREERTVMRGKLQMEESLRLQMQQTQRLLCEYDEFSEDNLYNQILKTTLDCLIRSKDIDRQRRQNLQRLVVFFGEVSLIRTDSIPWKRLIYQRSNRNYELLLNLCYLLLHGMLQTTEDGNYRLQHFGDDHMERLYERFLLAYYQQHHPELHPAAPHIPWNLTCKPDEIMLRFLPYMRSDLVLQNGEKRVIIDAKYYEESMSLNFQKSTLRSAHLYQIYTYVKNLDSLHTGDVSGVLLYAKTSEDGLFPNCPPFIMDGNRIGVRTIDLNCEFQMITEQLEDIVKEFFV